MYQNIGKLYLCGDFNARCGDMQDFIEGVDDVQIRDVIDDVLNRNGEMLIEFLVDCNLCMLNGRIGKQDYTNISSKGKSVVDYILTPHDQINDVIDFQVHTMSNIISRFDLAGYESIPDHSLLECTISTYAENTDTVEQLSENERLKAPRRFRYDGLRNELFSDEPMQKLLQETILRLEHALDRRRDVDSAFTELKNLLVTEIELTCKEQKQNIPNKRHHKNNRKPYWNEELQDLWDKACKAEKEWTSCKTNSKSTLRSIYVQRRKNFDTFNRKSKRRYQIEQQNQLHYLEGHNTKDFLKSIGKLGLANERKTQRIYQVRTENGEITNDTDTVLERWKTEYESAFNSVDSCYTYDETFLADIKNKVRNENNYRKDIDVSGLNLEISREEVKDAVYKAKLGKAIGIDEIPSEILRNDNCIDLLHKLVKFCFT
ncbi:Hypothetical predicted protein [Mytilus galloprovincialis]|uniref:Endonuclease/exonuclease/phosphatase domain-containing protein n=1 Tax=Mytilus galloprovincialis TaxID=29158 RepID=A0A8B6E6K5_MYTGA|nr:Hypothetical predicted protein [Mytilus galloprovincialis]